jgi:SAM-dependent methyltransferase
MRRVPEPELMDDRAQAEAYAAADFSEPNTLFVDLLDALLPDAPELTVLDLGCGPADIPMRLVERHPGLQVDAVDGAAAMLALAQRVLDERPSLAGRLRLHCARLPSDALAVGHYACVASNSLLHHLDDPGVLWQSVKTHGRPGAAVLVMDLARPSSPTAVDALVETHAIDAPEILRRDFRNSLFAAYTPQEVRDQLRLAGLGALDVGMVSDRHLAVRGHLPG